LDTTKQLSGTYKPRCNNSSGSYDGKAELKPQASRTQQVVTLGSFADTTGITIMYSYNASMSFAHDDLRITNC